MTPILQRDLVNFLRPLPQFESENSRKALLITAGLNNIIASIELRGSADEFVPLLVRRLEAFGALADDEPALVVLLRSLARDLGQEKKAAIREFCARLLDDEPARLMARCPYRGLEAFRENDEQYFFGRDAYAAKLVEAVQQSPFVAVIGASGSGKSSLVFAGLIPQLRREFPSSEGLHELPSWEGLGVGKWQIATLRPLTNPFYEMASALFPMLDPEANEVETMRQIEQLTAALQAAEIMLAGIVRRIARKSPASRLLIAIDQFEELYAPENAATCRAIIEQLLQLIADTSLPVSVVITLRSDFLGQTNSNPDFSHLIAEHNLLVPAMNADELRAAIAEPAQKVGQPLSAEVVDLLIEQAKEREGALPLLEFALTQIWQGMAQGVEPADTLKQIGGVGGALANKAKELFDSLAPAEQQIARRAFLAMTRLGEGTKDTRRRAALAEMVGHQNAPDEVRNVLRLFAQPGARLLTLAEDAAEITHEALFEHWDALKQWIDANRDDLRFLRQVNDAAQHWDAQGRPDGSLWRRPNLDLLQTFHARAAVDMTALQVAFFQESEHKEKQTRFQKRLMWAGLVILTVISVIGTIWAIRSEKIAQQERKNADIRALEALEQKRIAEEQKKQIEKQRQLVEIKSIEGLSLASKALFLAHDDLGALLAIIKAGKLLQQANSTPETLQKLVSIHFKEILYNIFEKNRLEILETPAVSVVFSPDNRILASGNLDGTIKLWDVETGKEIKTLQGHTDVVLSVKFSPDGKILASGGGDNTIRLWNIEVGREYATLKGHSGFVYCVDFNSTGTILASASEDRTIKLWNAITNNEIKTLHGHDNSVVSIDFSPDDKILISGSDDTTVKLWSVLEGNEMMTLHGHTDIVYSVNFHPEGSIIASGSNDTTIKLWNITTGEEIKTLRGHSGFVSGVNFSPDGKILASSSYDKVIRLWDFISGNELASLNGHTDAIYGINFNSDSSMLSSVSWDKTIRLWNIHNLYNDNVVITDILDLDELLNRGCEWLSVYLKTNPHIPENDRFVCDNIHSISAGVVAHE